MDLLDTLKRPDFIRDSAIAVGFLLVGIIASSAVEDWRDASFGITPVRLSNLLQNTDIKGFNDLRKQFHEKIEFDGIDLSDKNLKDANLKSIVLRNVNLSKTNLENAILDDSEISGDLSNVILRDASLLNAVLARADLTFADLTPASLRAANLCNGVIIGSFSLLS
jgi:uncharacterized protein YjbI with pentapeptide repeats